MPKFHEKNSKSFRKYTTNIWNHQHAITPQIMNTPTRFSAQDIFFWDIDFSGYSFLWLAGGL